MTTEHVVTTLSCVTEKRMSIIKEEKGGEGVLENVFPVSVKQFCRDFDLLQNKNKIDTRVRFIY